MKIIKDYGKKEISKDIGEAIFADVMELHCEPNIDRMRKKTRSYDCLISPFDSALKKGNKDFEVYKIEKVDIVQVDDMHYANMNVPMMNSQIEFGFEKKSDEYPHNPKQIQCIFRKKYLHPNDKEKTIVLYCADHKNFESGNISPQIMDTDWEEDSRKKIKEIEAKIKSKGNFYPY